MLIRLGYFGKKSLLVLCMSVFLEPCFLAGLIDPWLTKELLQAMRKRNSLYRQAKVSGNFAEYKRHRNRLVTQLRLAKKSYFLKINADSTKSFWRACRSLYKQSGAGVPVLSAPDGTTVNLKFG